MDFGPMGQGLTPFYKAVHKMKQGDYSPAQGLYKCFLSMLQQHLSSLHNLQRQNS